jgi:phosphoglycolate phosphatase-like HAD superfamily hydrolase
LNLDLSRTVFVGDDERDGEAADRAGCPFVKVSEDRSLLDWVQELLKDQKSEGNQHHEQTTINHRA